MRIIVVEDEPGIRRAFERYFRITGHDVSVFSSGEAVLAAVEAGAEPEALITDNNLAGKMTGGELAVRLVQRVPGLRVAVMSGRVVDLTYIPEGAKFFMKPASMESIAAYIGAGREV